MSRFGFGDRSAQMMPSASEVLCSVLNVRMSCTEVNLCSVLWRLGASRALSANFKQNEPTTWRGLLYREPAVPAASCSRSHPCSCKPPPHML